MAGIPSGRLAMHRIVPEGEKLGVAIEHFDVSRDEAAFANIRARSTNDVIQPGKYCRLKIRNELYMSDAQMEWATNWRVRETSNGDVLIAGLGIGLILWPILTNPDVRSVTVLEKWQGVIDLVEKPLRENIGRDALRLSVIHADAFTWRPPRGRLWDTIYFDIWPSITFDNLEGMTRLKRKYAKRLNRKNPRAWMGCWREEELRRAQARDR
jgi:hypothetical protein